MTQFKLLKRIGRGFYACVYKAILMVSGHFGEEVALRIEAIPNDELADNLQKKRLERFNEEFAVKHEQFFTVIKYGPIYLRRKLTPADNAYFKIKQEVPPDQPDPILDSMLVIAVAYNYVPYSIEHVITKKNGLAILGQVFIACQLLNEAGFYYHDWHLGNVLCYKVGADSVCVVDFGELGTLRMSTLGVNIQITDFSTINNPKWPEELRHHNQLTDSEIPAVLLMFMGCSIGINEPSVTYSMVEDELRKKDADKWIDKEHFQYLIDHQDSPYECIDYLCRQIETYV